MVKTKTAGNQNEILFDAIYEKRSRFSRDYNPGIQWMCGLFRAALDNGEPARVRSVLDIGCGDGVKTVFLKREMPHADVLGVDFSSVGIAAAESAYGGEGLSFRCLDAEDQSLWEQRFDLISAFEVLEHVDDWQGLLGKMCTNTNQYLLLSVPCGKLAPREGELMGHVRRFRRGEIEDFLKSKGFSPLALYYAGFPFYNMGVNWYLRSTFLRKTHSEQIGSRQANWLSKMYYYLFTFLYQHASTKRHFGMQFVGLFEAERIRSTTNTDIVAE